MITDINKVKISKALITEVDNIPGMFFVNLLKKALKSLNVSYNDTCCDDINIGDIPGDDQDLILTNRQTASYVLVLTDAKKLVEMNVAGVNTLTIPPFSAVAFPLGTQIMLAEYGAGQTTITAGVGVTINSAGGRMKLASQYSGATITKIGTNEWYLFGDTTA